MQRAGQLAIALLAWIPASDFAGLAPAGEPPRKPNVLLIMTDDQGYGDFSLHGNPHLQTPHIDALAQSGVQFERFYVNSFCSPTRAALLTGRYPLRCGVWGVTHNKETMRRDEVTLAEALRSGGYRTACIGKWHNGEQFPYTPPGQGFDEFFGFHNGHINNYFDTELIRGAQPVPTQGYITDVLTDEAIRFLRRAATSRCSATWPTTLRIRRSRFRTGTSTGSRPRVWPTTCPPFTGCARTSTTTSGGCWPPWTNAAWPATRSSCS